MNDRTHIAARRLIAAAVATATLGSFSTLALAQAAPPPPRPGQAAPPPPPATRPAEPLEGTVASYNFGPDGERNSMMLSTADGRTFQVNFPPNAGESLAKIAVGSDVKLTAEPTRSMPNHPVYELASITGPDGKEMKLPKPGDEEMADVSGTVERLNYARDGRADGAVLDDGTFVHTGPEAAEAMQMKVGQKLSVKGRKRATMSGQTVVEADSVNGTPVPHPMPPRGGPRPKPPADGAGSPPPPPAPRPAPPRP